MPEGTIHLAWGAATDRGLRRTANEDSFLAEPPLFLVADGMGGHDAGAAASNAALSAFVGLIGHGPAQVSDVEAAVEAATLAVGALHAPGSAPGTTLSGAVLSAYQGHEYWLIINIGDSRTYRLSAGRLEQVSIDHSAVQELVDRGQLDPADVERHPHRNVVTRAVGAGSTGIPDFWLLPVEDGDRLIVCSDGLTKEVPLDEMTQILRQEPSPQGAATRLVHSALVHGGSDNVTVVVVDAHGGIDADDDPTAPRVEDGIDDEIDEATHPSTLKRNGARTC